MVKKMTLTPQVIITIRQKLKPLAENAGVDINDVMKFIKKKDDELKGIINAEGIVELAKNKFKLNKNEEKKEENKMKDKNIEEFWNDVEFTERKEFPPFLTVKNGITFHLKLSDPSKAPRPHVDKVYGTPQFLWDVILTDVDSEIALDEGKYEVGKEYTLALNANRATKRFKQFWIDNNMEVDEFIFKRTGSSFQTDYVFKNK